ncbi:MAG: hypothetical protein HY735_34400 [Verrucomicrobia bacterium]|nr:hypothetical protein [Verrucomicrobiota bacterium]
MLTLSWLRLSVCPELRSAQQRKLQRLIRLLWRFDSIVEDDHAPVRESDVERDETSGFDERAVVCVQKL